jgi:hypothetical protein
MAKKSVYIQYPDVIAKKALKGYVSDGGLYDGDEIWEVQVIKKHKVVYVPPKDDAVGDGAFMLKPAIK